MRKEDGASSIEYGIMTALIALVILASIIVIGRNINKEPGQLDNTSNTISTSEEAIEDARLAIDKARAIGKLATQESEGLVHISFVAVPSHGISPTTNSEFFGVHYSMQILRRADLITEKEMNDAKNLAGRIFQLTTKHILKDNPAITHMGVQIVNPDAWFWEGADAHLYIASRNDLLSIPENANASSWFKISSNNPMILTSSRSR